MDEQELLEALGNLRTWRRRGMFAPHKPLLLLVALRRAGEGYDRLAPFDDWAGELTPLLRHFWHTQPNPGYPYWWLRQEELWEVQPWKGLVRRRGHQDPRVSELRKTVGGLTSRVFNMFGDARIAADAQRILVERYFPDVQHDEVRRRVGLAARS